MKAFLIILLSTLFLGPASSFSQVQPAKSPKSGTMTVRKNKEAVKNVEMNDILKSADIPVVSPGVFPIKKGKRASAQ